MTIDVARRLDERLDRATSATRGAGSKATSISTTPTSPVFNTSSFIQDGPGTNVEDVNRFGPLFEDRPHVFKVFTSYAVTSRVTASGFLRVQSGRAVGGARPRLGRRVLNYLEPAGSHRNPTVDQPRFDGLVQSAPQRRDTHARSKRVC